MKTNIRLIERALIILNQAEIALEQALTEASETMGLPILDDVGLIRSVLTENNFIAHNPRLTFLKQETRVAENISFISDEIHKDFIKDRITEQCRILMKNEELFHQNLEGSVYLR